MSKIKRPNGMSDKIKNYNYEEKSWFTKGYEKALEQKEAFMKRLDMTAPKKLRKFKKIHYDIDLDISNYNAWREFEKN